MCRNIPKKQNETGKKSLLIKKNITLGQDQKINYTKKVKTLSRVQLAHKEAVKTILTYVRSAQRMLRENQTRYLILEMS